jgi:hypothetical protein
VLGADGFVLAGMGREAFLHAETVWMVDRAEVEWHFRPKYFDCGSGNAHGSVGSGLLEHDSR